MHTSLFSGDAACLTFLPISTYLANVNEMDFGCRVCAAVMALSSDDWEGWTLERTYQMHVDIAVIPITGL